MANKLYMKKCESAKTPLQPYIQFIGSPVEICNISVAHIKYTTTSVVHAFEIAFSAYMALNVKYPDECRKIWEFIQQFLFNIETGEPKPASSLTLAHDLGLI